MNKKTYMGAVLSMPSFGEINFLYKLVGNIFDFESFDILLYI